MRRRRIDTPSSTNTIVYVGCTKEEWAAKSAEEKEAVKAQFKTASANIPMQLHLQEQMANDIRTIKNIAVFFAVFACIS